jgi:hypothetical protein
MSTRQKYIILFSIVVILIAIWIGSYFYQPKSYDLPFIKKINNVTKIELDRNGGTNIILVLTNGRWILQPGGYYADKSEISEMVEQLKTFSVSDLVSGGALQSYGLDEKNRIEIKAFDCDNEVMHFFIGKTGSTYSHTYVEFPGNNNVYLARGTFNYTFSKDAGSLKSREISSISKDDILEVRIRENGNEYVIDKINKPVTNLYPTKSSNSADLQIVWKSSWKKTPLNTAKFDALLQKLTPMTADSISTEQVDNKSQFLRSIELKTEKESVVINIIAMEKAGTLKAKERFYLLSVNGNPTIFKITDSLGRELLKSINDL